MTNLYGVFHKYKLQGQSVRKSGKLIFRDIKEQQIAISESYLDPDFQNS